MSNHGLLLGSCGFNLGRAAGAGAAGGWHVSVGLQRWKMQGPCQVSPHPCSSQSRGESGMAG